MSSTQSPNPHDPESSNDIIYDDPVYLHSRREAMVILIVWFTAALYSLVTCYYLAYNRQPEELTYIWGIPDWAFYGVILPWMACNLFTIWFCFCFVKEDDLHVGGMDEDSELLSTNNEIDT